MVSSQLDQLIWPTIVGKCTIKEATRYLYEIKDTTAGPSESNWIWKIPCVYKIQIFMSKCCHNQLPTKSFLANIHHDIDPTCPRCSHVETTSHVIRNCPWDKEFWINLPGQRVLVKSKSPQYKPCRVVGSSFTP